MFKLRHLTYWEYCIEFMYGHLTWKISSQKDEKKERTKRRIESMEIMRYTENIN